jgi:hypothetical protein
MIALRFETHVCFTRIRLVIAQKFVQGTGQLDPLQAAVGLPAKVVARTCLKSSFILALVKVFGLGC